MAMNKIEEIRGVITSGDRHLFPIHWLNMREYCEYQIFLENIRGVEAKPTPEMAQGKEAHERLYAEFKEKAVPSNFKEAVELLKTETKFSREVRVISQQHGIYGQIDEVWLKPNGYVVIDDKRGKKSYLSDQHQVLGYCLAFREIVKPLDDRPIVAALRERETDNIYWMAPFDAIAERNIVKVISRVHSLIAGHEQFTSNKNPNKCRPCHLRDVCDKTVV